MYPCHYPGCKEEFTNHTFLMNHILRDHGQSRVNWNSRFAAILAAVILALLLAVAPLLPAKAQEPQPPSVGEPPTIAVEHRLYMPFVSVADDVEGQGRYWGGQAQYVSWCPGCNPKAS